MKATAQDATLKSRKRPIREEDENNEKEVDTNLKRQRIVRSPEDHELFKTLALSKGLVNGFEKLRALNANDDDLNKTRICLDLVLEFENRFVELLDEESIDEDTIRCRKCTLRAFGKPVDEIDCAIACVTYALYDESLTMSGDAENKLLKAREVVTHIGSYLLSTAVHKEKHHADCPCGA